MADSKPRGSATSITCRYCSCCFAKISLETGLIPLTQQQQQQQVCASCHPFLDLYKTLQTKESEHTALLDRGPKHHGRKLALEQYRNAKVALENFLIAVETPREPASRMLQAGFVNRVEPVQFERSNAAYEQGDGQQILDERAAPARPVSPMGFSTTIKRKPECMSHASNGERKRIKFTETGYERAQYRSTEEFNRGSKGYVPGRYVPAEGSEFLDTSGSTKSFAKFTGQKKMGSGFVDIVPRDGEQEGEGVSPILHKKGTGKNKRTQSDKTSHEIQQTASQTNDRELRVSKRSRSTTPPATTRPQRTAAQYDGHQESPTNPPDESSLVVAPKPIEDDTTKKVEERARELECMEGCRPSLLDIASHEPGKHATEAASIRDSATNIQGDSRCL